MQDHQIKLSYVILFVVGFGLLFSLLFLENQNVAPWLAFKLLFFIGIVLMSLKR